VYQRGVGCIAEHIITRRLVIKKGGTTMKECTHDLKSITDKKDWRRQSLIRCVECESLVMLFGSSLKQVIVG